MANKYVIHGAAFDGDGTASNVAASDGAAGAWNDFEAVLSNTLTYGSYAVGDTIYVATNNGTSDLSFTRTGTWTWADLGNADDGNYVTLYFDDGTNVGSAGTFTLNMSNNLIISDWEVIGNNRFEIIHTNTAGYGGGIQLAGYFENITYTSKGQRSVKGINYRGYHCNGLTLNWETINNTSTPIIYASDGGWAKIENLVIDFTGSNISTRTPEIFSVNSQVQFGMYVNGLEIKGTSTHQFNLFTKVYDHSSNTLRMCQIVIDGLLCSGSITTDNLVKPPWNETEYYLDPPILVRGGENPFNSTYSQAAGYVAWTKGKNYPYLNASLPDGTGWSYLIKPTYAKKIKPLHCPPVRKLWESTASTVTVKLELAIDNRQTPKDSEVWMNVCYINNSNNKMEVESTRVFTASEATLATSTATWNPNPPTYGAITLDEYKLELTTANSVKQYTEIVVHLFVGLAAFDSNSFWFYCPDVVLT